MGIINFGSLVIPVSIIQPASRPLFGPSEDSELGLRDTFFAIALSVEVWYN